ncbi:MAG: hypothetical protein IPO60_05360 [Flavobacteriales bacterium]|nr:hypothetical protein [Flavobacteriales bacterium]
MATIERRQRPLACLRPETTCSFPATTCWRIGTDEQLAKNLQPRTGAPVSAQQKRNTKEDIRGEALSACRRSPPGIGRTIRETGLRDEAIAMAAGIERGGNRS